MLGFSVRPSDCWSELLDKNMLVCLEMPKKASGIAGDFGTREVPKY